MQGAPFESSFALFPRFPQISKKRLHFAMHNSRSSVLDPDFFNARQPIQFKPDRDFIRPCVEAIPDQL